MLGRRCRDRGKKEVERREYDCWGLGSRRCRDRKKKEVESGEYEAGDRKIFPLQISLNRTYD